MYIFGYFFPKEHFKGSSKKEHINKKLLGGERGGGGWHPPSPPALEGLSPFQLSLVYMFWSRHTSLCFQFLYFSEAIVLRTILF